MNRKLRLGLLTTFLIAFSIWNNAHPAIQTPQRSGNSKPNVILIVADDLGYADLGVQGCKDIPTPNIDSIAKNGVRFTNGYVSCPVCSPTRAGLLTGRYQQRFGHEFNPGPAVAANPDFGLPLTEVTIANRMKSLGYATGMFGKWHLGFAPKFQPQQRGFDEYFGFLGGAHSYLRPAPRSQNPILRGSEPVQSISYTTDEFANEAVTFIDNHRNAPFFVYLPFNSVHAPLEATEKYSGRFGTITDEKRRTYAAMLSAMDDGVGRILSKLSELGLAENTLILFISDNGGPTAQTTSRNNPLRGFKGQVLEGGIRIPFMMQWKGKLPAGMVDDRPVISLDIHPTIYAAAGGKLSSDTRLDGVDLVPYLLKATTQRPHDRLYWRFGEQSAIRAGEWKLLRQRGASPQLFNLSNDVGERNDLAASRPDKLKELQAAYDQWNSGLMKPLWERAPAPGQQRRR